MWIIFSSNNNTDGNILLENKYFVLVFVCEYGVGARTSLRYFHRKIISAKGKCWAWISKGNKPLSFLFWLPALYKENSNSLWVGLPHSQPELTLLGIYPLTLTWQSTKSRKKWLKLGIYLFTSLFETFPCSERSSIFLTVWQKIQKMSHLSAIFSFFRKLHSKSI